MSELAELIRQLEEGEVEEQCEAAESLAQCGEQIAQAAVPLLSTLGAEDIELNEWVMAALEEVERPDPDDLPMFVALLNEPGDRGYWAATLIGRLGPAAESTVPHLRDALEQNDDRSVRQRIVWSLGKIGPPAAPVCEDLERLASDSDARLARLAKQSLEQIAGEA